MGDGTKLLDQGDLAELLGLKPRTLENWRCHGYGPRFVKVGGARRYRLSDVEAWLSAQTQGTKPTRPQQPAA